MSTVDTTKEAKFVPAEKFTIISLLDNKSGQASKGIQFNSVKRNRDGEVFTIGDTVTNGTKMRGAIKQFDLLEGELFVITTWSGIGMNLDSLIKIIILPCEHQIEDEVWFNFWSTSIASKVVAVHFYAGKVKYSLDVFMSDGSTERIINIDAKFLSKVHPNHKDKS